ncbi:uncharacterized protein B0H18DRAFT_1013815 [Fomitopsis serialis]|uniref:uncharacterized protein n=1 Tax=Fomitopsis serialis TaxID=139415 RepID=UPI002008E0D5|nr:uncharacterized protein B0H18DRAFT_1013815 [Neoantrodia serialis]KAH9923866.1 hypothetical protein B0H18DRAFT_1013815 [Neoantrodia serialis]
MIAIINKSLATQKRICGQQHAGLGLAAMVPAPLPCLRTWSLALTGPPIKVVANRIPSSWSSRRQGLCWGRPPQKRWGPREGGGGAPPIDRGTPWRITGSGWSVRKDNSELPCSIDLGAHCGNGIRSARITGFGSQMRWHYMKDLISFMNTAAQIKQFNYQKAGRELKVAPMSQMASVTSTGTHCDGNILPRCQTNPYLQTRHAVSNETQRFHLHTYMHISLIPMTRAGSYAEHIANT